MAAAGKLRYAYLAFLSRPQGDRRLYRLVKRLRATKIVELGIGSIDRSLKLVSVCQRYSPNQPIRYTGLDRFEERPSGAEALSLIEAHRHLSTAGAEPRLMPGGPTQAFPAVANSLLRSDLVLISGEVDDASLASVWFYLPRILHEESVVLRGAGAEGENGVWKEVDRADIDRQADAATAARAA